VAWDIVRGRALRLSRVGVGVSAIGSLVAMGIPKNWCSNGICRLIAIAVALRDTVTVPDCHVAELDLPRLEVDQHKGRVRRAENLHLGKVASQDWHDALLRCGMQCASISS